jgi:hypothetical protein
VHTWGSNSNGQLLSNGGGGTTYVPTNWYSSFNPWNNSITSTGGTTPLLLNFTGQHRCFLELNNIEGQSLDVVKTLEGLIVVSDRNTYVDPTLNTRTIGPSGANDALPVVSLCNKERDKRAFGVISASVDLGVKRGTGPGSLVPCAENGDLQDLEEHGDVRAQINAIGDGAIWVIESACALAHTYEYIETPADPSGIPVDPSTTPADPSTTPTPPLTTKKISVTDTQVLQAGDLITTSCVKGYGIAQGDDSMRSCTVAKLTMDCDFSPPMAKVEHVRRDVNGLVVIDPATGGPFWDEDAQGSSAYQLRYVVVADGSTTTYEEWAKSVVAGDGLVRRAALLGCTYHSG